MSNVQVLSPKPSIDEALVFLGMSQMDKVMGIQALLRITDNDKLPLFFNKRLICVPASMNYGNQYDENGEHEETLFVDPEDEIQFLCNHIPYMYILTESTDNTLIISIGGVIHDGIVYDICKGNGRILDYLSIKYEIFYFDREQLINFKTEYSTHFSQSKKVNDAPSKPAKISEQRITAFKYWLVGNSGMSIHDPDELQSCYEKLKSPTRDQVWSRLQKMDKSLFASGQDEFNTAMGKVIQFKTGTGKGRNS